MVTILKIVCAFAICATGSPGVMDSTRCTYGVTMQTTVNMTVPMMLNIRWITVVRRAFTFVPMEASTAVMQVPMFCPKSTYTALDSGIIPVAASACRIPTDAEDDWITAVNTAPTRIPRSGLLNCVIRLINASDSWSGSIAAPIMSIPMNRTPSPAKMLLIWCTFSLLTNIIAATPAMANTGAIAPISSAMSCPVIVVPILAPMMTQTAWFRVINPELTKPTTMTVVAEDDWITAVMAAPTSTPLNRFDVSFSRIDFILLPAAASRPVLIICIPYRKRARPPSKESTSVIPIPLSPLHDPHFQYAVFLIVSDSSVPNTR